MDSHCTQKIPDSHNGLQSLQPLPPWPCLLLPSLWLTPLRHDILLAVSSDMLDTTCHRALTLTVPLPGMLFYQGTAWLLSTSPSKVFTQLSHLSSPFFSILSKFASPPLLRTSHPAYHLTHTVLIVSYTTTEILNYRQILRHPTCFCN